MGEALTCLGAVPQDWAPTQAGSRVTGGLVVDGLGDGAVVVGVVPAGDLVTGAAVVAGGAFPGVAAWSVWLVRQPVRATLVSSRAVAMVGMGRMLLISFGSGTGGPRAVRPAGSRRRAGGYGTYCSAILTTWSWRTVIQNRPPPPCGSTIASRSRGSRTFLVALPV